MIETSQRLERLKVSTTNRHAVIWHSSNIQNGRSRKFHATKLKWGNWSQIEVLLNQYLRNHKNEYGQTFRRYSKLNELKVGEVNEFMFTVTLSNFFFFLFFFWCSNSNLKVVESRNWNWVMAWSVWRVTLLLFRCQQSAHSALDLVKIVVECSLDFNNYQPNWNLGVFLVVARTQFQNWQSTSWYCHRNQLANRLQSHLLDSMNRNCIFHTTTYWDEECDIYFEQDVWSHGSVDWISESIKNQFELWK